MFVCYADNDYIRIRSLFKVDGEKLLKRDKRKKKQPEQEFNAYYESLFEERWPALLEALKLPAAPAPYNETLLRPYYLDEASIAAALALDVQPRHRVLDMCAAPGGKSLIIASKLQHPGSLIANDRSASRRARLKQVLKDHLTPDQAALVTVTGHDAARWGLYEQNIYDRILLDAPCSSERHVIQSAKHLSRWGAGRTRRLAAQAWAMLAAGFTALKPGGILLYSTCALSPLENDGVIDRLAEKRSGLWEPVSVLQADGLINEGVIACTPEPARRGVHILPDTSAGRGPLYISGIRKL